MPRPQTSTLLPYTTLFRSPSSAGGRSPALTRTTARSERGPAPITCHSSSRPSTREAEPPADPSTTCADVRRSEEHTSELQSARNVACSLPLGIQEWRELHE